MQRFTQFVFHLIIWPNIVQIASGKLVSVSKKVQYNKWREYKEEGFTKLIKRPHDIQYTCSKTSIQQEIKPAGKIDWSDQYNNFYRRKQGFSLMNWKG